MCVRESTQIGDKNMKSIGLDIGTTTICGILLEAETGNVLESETHTNDSAITTGNPYEKVQNVKRILEICNQIVENFAEKYKDISNIGITGQMHGILYIDQEGEVVSPLYSWQDGRGNLLYRDNVSYSTYMTEISGYKMATGYGLTTHFYQQENNEIPKEAVCFCTVPDYVAMKFAQKKRPVLHKSMAASLGLFDVEKGAFDEAAVKKLRMSMDYFPMIGLKEIPIGVHELGIKVSMAFGDNQASFLGSVNQESNILINIGTGSQVSVFSKTYHNDVSIEYRPYLEDTFLMVGSPLCGGASYALLKNFYQKTLEMFGCTVPDEFYSKMNRGAAKVYEKKNKVTVDTRFNGTRENPNIRGSIGSLGIDNFTPEQITLGLLEGICEELYAIYQSVPAEDKKAETIIGSGNGIRKNPLLQKIVEDRFEKTLCMPIFKEEASCGAALYSLYCSGYFQSVETMKTSIRTEKGAE